MRKVWLKPKQRKLGGGTLIIAQTQDLFQPTLEQQKTDEGKQATLFGKKCPAYFQAPHTKTPKKDPTN